MLYRSLSPAMESRVHVTVGPTRRHSCADRTARHSRRVGSCTSHGSIVPFRSVSTDHDHCGSTNSDLSALRAGLPGREHAPVISRRSARRAGKIGLHPLEGRPSEGRRRGCNVVQVRVACSAGRPAVSRRSGCWRQPAGPTKTASWDRSVSRRTFTGRKGDLHSRSGPTAGVGRRVFCIPQVPMHSTEGRPALASRPSLDR
jgi:hypothetical protein